MPNNRVVAIHSQAGSVLTKLSTKWLGLILNLRNDLISLDNPFSVRLSSAQPSYLLETLLGAQAQRVPNDPTFVRTVSNPNTVLITGLGHGAADEFIGFNGALYKPSFVPQNEVQGRIVHLLSCSTAAGPNGLGSAFVTAKARAFIGYTTLVSIESQHDDWVTKFLKCDLGIDISLMTGATVSNAVADAKAQFRQEGIPDGQSLISIPDNFGEGLPSTSTPTPATLPRNLISPNAPIQPNSIPLRSM